MSVPCCRRKRAGILWGHDVAGELILATGVVLLAGAAAVLAVRQTASLRNSTSSIRGFGFSS